MFFKQLCVCILFLVLIISSASLALRSHVFLSPLFIFFFNDRVCGAQRAGACFCGAPPPLFEQACAGDRFSKRVRQVCCCYVMLSWRADDVRPFVIFEKKERRRERKKKKEITFSFPAYILAMDFFFWERRSRPGAHLQMIKVWTVRRMMNWRMRSGTCEDVLPEQEIAIAEDRERIESLMAEQQKEVAGVETGRLRAALAEMDQHVLGLAHVQCDERMEFCSVYGC